MYPADSETECGAGPTRFIMDNRFYYGEYKIIGHSSLSEYTDYPIMYGLSISMRDKDKILFQKGHVYREIPPEGNKVVSGDFGNNDIGWSLNLQSDLRHPKNKLQLEQMQKQMEI